VFGVAAPQLELNEYADLTWEQFSQQKLGFKGAQALQRYVCVLSCPPLANRLTQPPAPPPPKTLEPH